MSNYFRITLFCATSTGLPYLFWESKQRAHIKFLKYRYSFLLYSDCVIILIDSKLVIWSTWDLLYYLSRAILHVWCQADTLKKAGQCAVVCSKISARGPNWVIQIWGEENVIWGICLGVPMIWLGSVVGSSSDLTHLSWTNVWTYLGLIRLGSDHSSSWTGILCILGTLDSVT